MIDAEPREAADRFWQDAGGAGPFPRNLERAISYALPLAVTRFPHAMWTRHVQEWLAAQLAPLALDGPDRPLHGCLIAWRGHGWILMDGTDPEDELRFTLAHEAAHFMLDYLAPRARAARRYGSGVMEVLDGLRPATTAERVDAVLAGVPVGVLTHLMERRPDGAFGCAEVGGMEMRADRLALELLAPAAEVRGRIDPTALAGARETAVVATLALLVDTFGLPRGAAAAYAERLCGAWFGRRSVRAWLGLARSAAAPNAP